MLRAIDHSGVTKAAARANVSEKFSELRMSAHPMATIDVSIVAEIRDMLENDLITPCEAIALAGEIYARNEGSI